MECMNDRASLELLWHANASLRRFFQRFAGAPARLIDEASRKPFLVVEKNFQYVLRRELLMAFTEC